MHFSDLFCFVYACLFVFSLEKCDELMKINNSVKWENPYENKRDKHWFFYPWSYFCDLNSSFAALLLLFPRDYHVNDSSQRKSISSINLFAVNLNKQTLKATSMIAIAKAFFSTVEVEFLRIVSLFEPWEFLPLRIMCEFSEFFLNLWRI